MVDDVGTSPAAVLHEVIRGVQDRAGEPEPPVEIAPELWYGDGPDPAPPADGQPKRGSAVDAHGGIPPARGLQP